MSKETKLLIIFVGLFIAGIVGYLSFKNLPTGYILAHIGAFGLIGILAYLTGIIARKKDLNHWRAIGINIVMPIAISIAFVLITFYTGN